MNLDAQKQLRVLLMVARQQLGASDEEKKESNQTRRDQPFAIPGSDKAGQR